MSPESELCKAKALIAAGGVVLHATEGVWGFACDPFSQRAVQRVLAIKARPEDKGLIVIGADLAQFSAELTPLPASAQDAIRASWPGAITWVVPNVRFPSWVTGGRATVAVRVPGHSQARALANAAGQPLVSTSANRSGAAATVTEAEARAQFAADVDLVLPGAVLNPGQPSQMRSLDGERLR